MMLPSLRLLLAILLLGAACNDQPLALPSTPSKTASSDATRPAGSEAPNPYAAVDRSPMDVAYFPTDFPVQRMRNPGANALPVARVLYSRPYVQGRSIFGSLVPWGQPWRMGANEATEIEFFQPVTIQGKAIVPGRYVLYAVPGEREWILALNSQIYSWGLKIDPAKDVQRFTVPVEKGEPRVEFFTIAFSTTKTGADMIVAWDELLLRLPITVSNGVSLR